MDGFWKKIFRKDNKRFKIKILCVFIAGIVFMAAGRLFSPEAEYEEAAEEENIYTYSNVYAEEQITEEDYIEKKLEDIFSQVEGAGSVMVMVRTASKGEIVVAEEKKTSENISSEANGEKVTEITEEKTVVLMENKDGTQVPLIIKNVENPIEGILIVAEGGGDISVKDALVSAAQALLNLPANKIQVLKMK